MPRERYASREGYHRKQQGRMRAFLRKIKSKLKCFAQRHDFILIESYTVAGCISVEHKLCVKCGYNPKCTTLDLDALGKKLEEIERAGHSRR